MAEILIADDSAGWRARIREILEPYPEWRIIGEACDGQQAVCKTAELDPDLVLLDIGMPVLNGLEASSQILQISPRCKVVFLTQESDPDIVSAALATGATSLVQKTKAGCVLVDAIASALGTGKRYA